MSLSDASLFLFCTTCGKRYHVRILDLSNRKYRICNRILPENLGHCKGQLMSQAEMQKKGIKPKGRRTT